MTHQHDCPVCRGYWVCDSDDCSPDDTCIDCREHSFMSTKLINCMAADRECNACDDTACMFNERKG
jgi:hypothetical protein